MIRVLKPASLVPSINAVFKHGAGNVRCLSVLVGSSMAVPKVERHSLVSKRDINTVRRGGTFHYQKSMPRLPIPKLDDTLDRYLFHVEPLVSADEFMKTKELVEAFRTGEGKVLHERLLQMDKAAPEQSFINPFWDDMYFEMRSPLCPWVNPFLQMKDDPREDVNEQIARASTLVAASMRFYDAVDNEYLEPDVFHLGTTAQSGWFKYMINFVPKSVAYYVAYFVKSYPLDMSQYDRLFASTRYPKHGRDETRIFPGSRHILVISNDQQYRLNVIKEDGSYLDVDEIAENLRAISADSYANASTAVPMGTLTAQERNLWASQREALEKNPKNKDALHEVDSALFVLGLDDQSPKNLTECSKLFLYSGNNRWFDKCFSLIVSKNGKAAVNFEHSWGDGVCVLRYANETYEEAVKIPLSGKETGNMEFSKLEYDLSGDHIKFVDEAVHNLRDRTGPLDMETRDYFTFGKEYMKNKNISPDGTVQHAIQLAHFRRHGKVVATYESASTAGFKRGRTETIRTVTPDTVEFLKAFTEGKSDKEKEEALRKTVETHRQITTNAAIGKGMDRHMFAMMNVSKKENGTIPNVFQDKAWKVLNHNILSTSTLTSPSLEGGGFGPVVDDGYGVGYGVVDEGMRFSISSYEHDVSGFIDEVTNALDEFKALLDQSTPPPEK